MIGQTCDHRGCSWQPMVIGILNTKCSHRPTKVVRVHGKIGHGVMDIPIFRKTIAFTNLASIAVAVRTIHTQSDFPDRVCRNQGTFYSDNRTLQGLPWLNLRNINWLRGNDLPHIPEIGNVDWISSVIMGHKEKSIYTKLPPISIKISA